MNVIVYCGITKQPGSINLLFVATRDFKNANMFAFLFDEQINLPLCHARVKQHTSRKGNGLKHNGFLR